MTVDPHRQAMPATSRRCRASPPPRARRRSAPAALARGDGQVAHLAARPRLAPCRRGAGARRAAPARRSQGGSTAAVRAGANQRSPSRFSITRRRMLARREQRRAGQRAHLQVELRHVAGVDAVVAASCAAAAPSRWRPARRRRARRTRRTARRRSRAPRRPGAAQRRPPRPGGRRRTAAAGTRVTARMPSRCRFCCTGRCDDLRRRRRARRSR